MNEKMELLARYRNETLRMKTALEGGWTPAVLEMTKRRRQIIERIDALDRASARAAGMSPGFAGTGDRKLMGETMRILEEVSQLDGECVAAMEAAVASQKKEILENQRKRQVRREYRSSSGESQARFFDQTIR